MSRSLIAIFHDRFQVLRNLFGAEQRPVLRIETIEPVYQVMNINRMS